MAWITLKPPFEPPRSASENLVSAGSDGNCGSVVGDRFVSIMQGTRLPSVVSPRVGMFWVAR